MSWGDRVGGSKGGFIQVFTFSTPVTDHIDTNHYTPEPKDEYFEWVRKVGTSPD